MKIMKTENLEKFMRWYQEGLLGIKILKIDPDNYKGWIHLQAGAIVCAEFDRKHARKETQELNSKCWEYAYLKHECSYEEYFESGYFKEKYLKEKKKA